LGSEIRDPGRVKIRIRDTGSGINIPDPQHCSQDFFLPQDIYREALFLAKFYPAVVRDLLGFWHWFLPLLVLQLLKRI
jgi:hypothetical protein